MGYRDRTLRLALEDLGDGCFVEIRNPKLLTRARIDEMFAAAKVEGKDDVDNDVLLEAHITAWKMWDVDSDEELPLPAGDGATVKRAPAVVGRWINEKVGEAADPR